MSTETTGTSLSGDALQEKFDSFAGQSTGPPTPSPEPVNRPMIRHWVEAMGDYNPVYLDDAAAKAAGFPGVIAPPTMLQAWIMWGLRHHMKVNAARAAGGDPGTGNVQDQVMRLLDAAGYTSVVATNCDQHYERPLVLGDEVSVTSVVESISPEKTTALGVGRFLTTRMDYSDATGALVATMRFRILKFRPRTAPSSTDAAETATRPKRPRPSLTQDNSFFFEGAKEGKLLIQRCSECGTLRHPPRPACPNCRSFHWDALQASGRGTIYSYVVNHYPQVPAFDYPLIVALVELEEGTRLVANVSHMTPETVAIGMPVIAEFESFDDELSLPVFRPADGSGAPVDTANPAGAVENPAGAVENGAKS